ncbi:MAG TPA: hypothetical protein QF800_00730 [Phycisphaerales bacterium]|nr:hypothetical protein [Phycisphaerales bacterium]
MNTPLLPLGLFLAFIIATSGTGASSTQQATTTHASDVDSSPLVHQQLSQFVRRIFQDNRRHLWLGTNCDGVPSGVNE